jgi:hypothetical protein
MGTSRQITEGQLEQAKSDRDLRAKALEGKGIGKDKFHRDPQWRSLDAKVRQIVGRLRHITEVETVDEDLKKSKEDRLAARAARRVERKASRKTQARKGGESRKRQGRKSPQEGKGSQGKEGSLVRQARLRFGEVTEWPIVQHWKCCVHESGPGVRIPPSPLKVL